jgi:hypothetical protein
VPFVHQVGLIVQGPLRSRGRRGTSRNVAYDALTPADIVDFNCIDTIGQNLSRVDHGIPERDGLVPVNNKYRQILGFLRGCETLAERGCTLVAKVRTDQSIDVPRLLTETENLCGEGFDIITPYFDTQRPRSINDFYLGGQLDAISEFCSTYLSSPEKARSVHRDLYCHLGKTAQQRASRLRSERFQHHFLRYRGWEGVGIYSRQIFESTIWRGELLNSHPEMRFAGEVFGGGGIGRLDFLRSVLWDPLRKVAYRTRDAYRRSVLRPKGR